MTHLAPHTEEELAEITRAALSQGQSLDIVGGNSRAGLGRPANSDLRLDLGALSGIILYEPSELVLTAKAGTPLAEITRALDEQGQELAFEPLDHGPLYGHAPHGGTLGGMMAVNASGPRRIRAGAARDHLLGFRAVNGRGEVFQSGGRVMKNVTGYDMSKLMAGSYGTFGPLCELSVKVLPRAETALSIALAGLDDEAAIEIMTAVSGLSFEVSGFAHLPALDSAFASPAPGEFHGQPLTLLRLEGPENSVAARKDQLVDWLHRHEYAPHIETLPQDKSAMAWAGLRDVSPFQNTGDILWRISTAPASGAVLLRDLRAKGVPVGGHFYDWAGGLIWLLLATADEPHDKTIRTVVNRHGGHATLIRARDELRARTPVFHPQPAPLAALTRRIRESFDPQLIFNRGRVREDL